MDANGEQIHAGRMNSAYSFSIFQMQLKGFPYNGENDFFGSAGTVCSEFRIQFAYNMVTRAEEAVLLGYGANDGYVTDHMGEDAKAAIDEVLRNFDYTGN